MKNSGRITVFGSSKVAPSDEAYQHALRLGRLLAEAGYIVYSGGYGGVMEAVSRGAAEAGGTAVGVTVQTWASRQRPNAWLSQEVVAPHLFDRMQRLIASDAYVAMPGGLGTLGEVAVTWNLFQTDSIPVRPLILVGELWRRFLAHVQKDFRVDGRDVALVRAVDTVEEVIPLLRRVVPR